MSDGVNLIPEPIQELTASKIRSIDSKYKTNFYVRLETLIDENVDSSVDVSELKNQLELSFKAFYQKSRQFYLASRIKLGYLGAVNKVVNQILTRVEGINIDTVDAISIDSASVSLPKLEKTNFKKQKAESIPDEFKVDK